MYLRFRDLVRVSRDIEIVVMNEMKDFTLKVLCYRRCFLENVLFGENNSFTKNDSSCDFVALRVRNPETRLTIYKMLPFTGRCCFRKCVMFLKTLNFPTN